MKTLSDEQRKDFEKEFKEFYMDWIRHDKLPVDVDCYIAGRAKHAELLAEKDKEIEQLKKEESEEDATVHVLLSKLNAKDAEIKELQAEVDFWKKAYNTCSC